MPNLSRILVPVDFTKRTEPALEYAKFLAERYQAEILVLHVWEPPRYKMERDVKVSVGGDTRKSLRDIIQGQASEELYGFLDKHRDGSLKLSGRLECGLPSATILDIAAARAAPRSPWGSSSTSMATRSLSTRDARERIRSGVPSSDPSSATTTRTSTFPICDAQLSTHASACRALL